MYLHDHVVHEVGTLRVWRDELAVTLPRLDVKVDWKPNSGSVPETGCITNPAEVKTAVLVVLVVVSHLVSDTGNCTLAVEGHVLLPRGRVKAFHLT